MTTPNIQFCSLCIEDDDNNAAFKWCTECETFLCIDCYIHHSKNKASKQHKTLPSNEYKKLPHFIINTVNRCPDHNQRYQLYCRNHSSACCLQCFTEKHQNCKDLKRLHDILNEMKSSVSISRLEKDLSNVVENCELVVTYLGTRLSRIREQKTKGIHEIQHIRKSINERLDKLEQNMTRELNQEYTKLTAKTEKLINQVETKNSQIKDLKEDLAKMKNFATELQTFIGLQEIEKTTAEEIGFLQNLIQSGDLEELNIEVKLSSDIKSILLNTTSFGRSSVTSTYVV
ncbi:unnamed protein product [Mytilus coruscus]|uniref:B box-type domain-containing protein n=1 Tax=Mytilus coruscus TaxID=42192 RepID=A0A6J8CK33_MYTCO|nr:unnamed protein product [Mytilus coruscus]